ncbi:MAG: asparagine synthase (glutamine-hydrolyzing) [Actinomycetota bacterium]
MCGIAGIVSERARDLSAIFAMNTAQEHRGRDGEGFLFVDGEDLHHGFSEEQARAAITRTGGSRPGGTVALGHRRLAILDTSDAGLQPMAGPEQRSWVIHNGEIYNYLELRAELADLGHRFTTGTDTEVILAAYAAWGTECFARFNGMWGMAIWDHQRRQLVLSRDRFGIKPLHVARTGGALVFASEIKAVLASGLVSARLDRDVAMRYLRWASTNTDTATAFDGIEAFPPGHTAVIDPERPEAWTAKPFYDLAAGVEELDVSFEEASNRFRELFLSSVDLRMRSDVPVGSCLSGGLDSSSVVCAASRDTEDPLQTFTASFDTPLFDERQWSDLVNRAVGATPHPVRPSATDFEREFQSLVWHQDEPFPSTSIFAQWAVMQTARRAEVPVLLDGQGGDEILCGYRKYYMFYIQTLLRQRRLLEAARQGVALIRNGDRQQWNFRKGGASRYLPDIVQRQLLSIGPFLQPTYTADWDGSVSGLGLAGNSIIDRQIADVNRHSVPSLLRYEDRNSMAWSIETRVPFMDHRLVEFAVSLPIELKLSGGVTKSVLRNGLTGLVPDAILHRNDKLGFNAPMADWLFGQLRPFVEDRLSRPDLPSGQIIDGSALLGEFRRRADKQDWDALAKIFRVVVFDAWMERFDVQAC